MTYAVVLISGKQFLVSEGQVLEVDKIEGEKGKILEFSQVYLLNNDGQIQIGQPVVKGATVLATIEEQLKGPKIMVEKFKAKVRYRRKKGFRPLLTKIKITKIRK